MEEKAYTCLTCNRKFHLKGNFKSHLKIHLNEKPFKCIYDHCNKSFATKAQFINHVKRHGNFQCNYCKNDFLLNVDLIKHMQICQQKQDDNTKNEKDDDVTITDESSFINELHEEDKPINGCLLKLENYVYV